MRRFLTLMFSRAASCGAGPRGVALLVSLLLLSTSGEAHPQKIARADPTSFFLSGDPHVPLAVVVGGHVKEAVSPRVPRNSCGAKDRWRKVGSQWNALDKWGQIVATRTVKAKNDYDVTGCAELTFGDKRDTDLYVSADSAYRAPPAARWVPSAAELKAFEALLVASHPDGHMPAEHVPQRCTAAPDRVMTFDVPGRGHHAVGGTNSGYLIARLDARGWSTVKSQRSPVKPPWTVCYRPIAVFDMNGDGLPEIVLRSSDGPSWGEDVLGFDANGGVIDIASSPGGSMA
jgi:hypothetical protein